MQCSAATLVVCRSCARARTASCVMPQVQPRSPHEVCRCALQGSLRAAGARSACPLLRRCSAARAPPAHPVLRSRHGAASRPTRRRVAGPPVSLELFSGSVCGYAAMKPSSGRAVAWRRTRGGPLFARQPRPAARCCRLSRLNCLCTLHRSKGAQNFTLEAQCTIVLLLCETNWEHVHCAPFSHFSTDVIPANLMPFPPHFRRQSLTTLYLL